MGSMAEIVKALVSPLEKLMEVVRGAIGKAYEPKHIRRIADAKAYEIATIGQALRANGDIPILYSKEDITMDTTDFQEFAERTQKRLAFQELTKQKNIEAVIDVAYSELDHEQAVTDEPVDHDWIIRFFNSVEDISNEQMQWIWGKLLAGEIKHPGTFSLRTLNILKNLTQNEAILFKEIVPYILQCKGDQEGSFDDYFLMNGTRDYLTKKYKIPFAQILKLSEAGLISDNGQIQIAFEVGPGKTELIRGAKKAIEIMNMSDESFEIYHSAYVLTETGKELISIIESNYAEDTAEYLVDCIEEIKNHGFRWRDKPLETSRISIKIVDF